MGVGAYACYKLTTLFPGVNIIVLILVVGLLRGRGRRAVRAAVAAHQGLLSRGRDARGAVLPVVVLHPRAVALQLQRLGAIEVPTRTLFGIPITGPNATPVTRYLVVLVDRRRDDLARLQSRARPHRPHVDGGARHGHRRRADRHQALPDQAARLRGVVVLLRRRRRDDGVPLARRRRGRQLQHQPVLPDPVHGDHRRARQPDRLVLRRRLHLGPADRAARRCPDVFGLADHARRPSSTCSS